LIGDLAVNCCVAPVYTLDADIVVADEQPHSVNVHGGKGDHSLTGDCQRLLPSAYWGRLVKRRRSGHFAPGTSDYRLLQPATAL
jgi:hypothetical protein